VNPLFALDRAEAEGKIPKTLAKRVRERAKYLVGAVKRVFGSRLWPGVFAGALCVNLVAGAPLPAALGIAAGNTLEAVAGHEFTHYLDLIRRLSRMSVMSDERAATLFESSFADVERTVNMKLIFKDRPLIKLVERKFPLGLVDDRLNALVEKKWIGNGLPVRIVAPEENVVRLGMGSVLSSSFDPRVIARISSLEEKVRS